MGNVINIFKNFVDWINVLNPVQVVALSLAVIIITEKRLGYIAQMDIERILSEQKGAFYERVALAIILFLFYGLCTGTMWRISIDSQTGEVIPMVVFVLMLVSILFWGISHHAKRKGKSGKSIFGMMLCMVFFCPGILTAVGLLFTVDGNLIFALCCLLSIVGTFYVTYSSEISLHTASKSIVVKRVVDDELLYYYSKLDDEYILCGDTKDRKKANKITTILVDRIIDGEYVLAYEQIEESADPNFFKRLIEKIKRHENSNSQGEENTEIVETSDDEQIAS